MRIKVTAYLAQKHRKTQSNLSNPEQEKLHSINLVVQLFLIIPFISYLLTSFISLHGPSPKVNHSSPALINTLNSFMTSRFRQNFLSSLFVLPLTLLDPRVRVKMEAHMLLNICPVSLPWQKHLHNDSLPWQIHLPNPKTYVTVWFHKDEN